MAPHYLTTTAWLIVVVFIVDEVTSNSLFKLRVKRDKRPTGTPISLPIQTTSTDDVFLGGTGSIGSGFIQTNFDESSLTKLQVPGISPTSNVAFTPSIKDDDSLTTLQVPGVSRPNFSSADFDESSLTRLQVPGFSRVPNVPNVGASTDDDESLTKLQVPGISRPNTGSLTSNLDEASLTQLQVPGVSRPNSGSFSPITSDDSSAKRQVSTSLRPAGSKFSAIDVDDAEVKDIAAFVAKALSKTLGRLRLVKIIEAETQDVAGKNYKLTLRLKNLSEDDGKHLICEVVVFDQSWTNTRILRESDCSPTKAPPTSTDDIGLDVANPFSISFPPNAVTDASPTKRQTPSTPRPIGGGYSPIDVDDDVKEIALFAGTAITAKRNAGPAKVTKIVKAESQIVAGTNFKLTLELSQPSAVVEKHIICDVVVFDQPWTKTRLLSEYSCKQNKNPSITTDSIVLDGKVKRADPHPARAVTHYLNARQSVLPVHFLPNSLQSMLMTLTSKRWLILR
uniref:Cathepsin o-like protein n=1 Tax=Daphnia magna TaxID=35525 RepID=A0A0P5K9U0_9CRUS